VQVKEPVGVASPAARQRLLRRGLWLEYATLGWNVVGAGLVLAAAVAAGSVALAGFGLDSLLEIVASLVVIWQLRGSTDPRRERTALRVLGVGFGLLALYVLGQSASTLATGARPAPSPAGIVWLAATLAAMLALAAGKARTGRALGNPVLQTEARVTLVDAYLAGAVLVGLLLNAALGWWWTDPLAALVIVYYGAREGLHAWREAGAHS
jgi:divalent metal cation (Fe/Co/Zn/Cd) transporter